MVKVKFAKMLQIRSSEMVTVRYVKMVNVMSANKVQA